MSDINQATKKRQRAVTMVAFGVLIVLLAVGFFFTQGGPSTRQSTVKLPFTSLGDQNDKNAWRAHSEAQLAVMTRDIADAKNGNADALSQLQKLKDGMADLSKRLDAAKNAPASAPVASSAASADRALLDKPIPLNGAPAKQGAILNPPFGQAGKAGAAATVAAPPRLDIINFDTPSAGDTGCVDPRFSALPIDQAKAAQQDCLNNKGKKGVTFIPATSFVRVFMLNGVDAPTGGEAQHDPLHVYLQVLDPANLPNARQLDITACRILTSAYGDVSSERTMMRGVTLACILRNGRTVEMEIKGNVIGEDGKEGVRGRLVSKSGSALAMSVLAGIASGIGTAFNQSASTLNTTALGATSIINPSQIGRAAIGSGVSGGADSLKQYYIRAAEKLFPVIETDGGRVVEFAVSKGAEYNGALSDVSDITTVSPTIAVQPMEAIPMNDEAKIATVAAFEAATKRCADDAGREASFARGEDGEYQQVEMRRAFAGWLGASSLVAHQIMGLARTAKDRFGGNAAFQSGFLQFLEHAAQLLDVTSDASSVPQPDARRDIDAAAFDDAALEGFNRAMKTKMAKARAAGRAGWWSAPAGELSAALRAHADKGDPLDVGVLAMMHWYLNVAIAPVPETLDQAVATGELVKVASDPHVGGQLEIKMPAVTIRVSGFPNGLTRGCKPLLWEQVEVVIRAARPPRPATGAPALTPSGFSASTEWLPAGRAAFQIGVELETVRAWAYANEVEHRDDNGTLMVECASVLARSHRHWREQVPEQRVNARAGVRA